MAVDLKPSTWLGAGYTLSSHLIRFETNDAANANKTLAGLTDTEGDPTTGDIRKVLFEIAEKAYQSWRTQVAAVNQPTKMTLTRSSIENPDGTISRTYSMQFVVSGGTVDVVSE